MVAAISIAIAAWERLFNPQPIEQIGLGLALALVATVVNGVVAWILLEAGRRLRSIALRADAHHLLTYACLHSCLMLKSWRLTNQMIMGGSSTHWSSGSSPVPKNGTFGMRAAYSHMFNGPVARASKITVITTPASMNPPICQSLG